VDATLSKMLCLHIPTLLPAAFAEMEVAPVVQTAALLGVGFLYVYNTSKIHVYIQCSEICTLRIDK
jgi:anaphase-promoting complex subunit 1